MRRGGEEEEPMRVIREGGREEAGTEGRTGGCGGRRDGGGQDRTGQARTGWARE